jgi:hypothetical protein
MVDRAIDDKSPDTLVVVSGEGFWTGSSTLPHLHHIPRLVCDGDGDGDGGRRRSGGAGLRHTAPQGQFLGLCRGTAAEWARPTSLDACNGIG